MPESNIAPYLTALQKRVHSEGVRVGSYPSFQQGVTVSLIGRDEERLLELGQEVCLVYVTRNRRLVEPIVLKVVQEIQGEVVDTKRVGEGSPRLIPINISPSSQ